MYGTYESLGHKGIRAPDLVVKGDVQVSCPHESYFLENYHFKEKEIKKISKHK